MANSYLYFNDQTSVGRILRRMLVAVKEADQRMADVDALIAQIMEGDGSQDAHHADLKARAGFESDAKARAFREEFLSAYSKTNGNGTVSNVRAARDQLIAKTMAG